MATRGRAHWQWGRFTARPTTQLPTTHVDIAVGGVVVRAKVRPVVEERIARVRLDERGRTGCRGALGPGEHERKSKCKRVHPGATVLMSDNDQ